MAEIAVNSLAHFQQHSRLHFIGQWKTKAESLMSQMYADHPEWNHGMLARQAIFIHVDMDAYFCNVALSKEENAKYRDCPVAIAAGKQNSDVSSCNYIARKFGVHAGMWVGQAKELCPQLVILKYDFARCEVLNREIYHAILRVTPATQTSVAMEVYSVDEVMLALSTADYDVARCYAEAIRDEIRVATDGCTASCGVGPSILVARLATAHAKPDGVKVVLPDDVNKFIAESPLTDLHGVGRATLDKLLPLIQQRFPSLAVASSSKPPGLVRTRTGDQEAAVTDEVELFPDDACADAVEPEVNSDAEAMEEDDPSKQGNATVLCRHLRHVSKQQLQDALGKKHGESLHQLCRGVDPRVVRRTGDAQNQATLGKTLPNAVGCSMNYAVRLHAIADVEHILRQLVGDVAGKLRRFHACASVGRVTILERHPDYPKATTKYMGTGKCVEVHIPVAFEAAVTGEQESSVLEAAMKAVSPWLTLDVAEKLRRPTQTILVEDIRGATVGLSSIHPIVRRVMSGSEMLPVIRKLSSSGSATGQISLTAAFDTVRRKRLHADTEDDVILVEQRAPRHCVLQTVPPQEIVLSSLDDEDFDLLSSSPSSPPSPGTISVYPPVQPPCESRLTASKEIMAFGELSAIDLTKALSDEPFVSRDASARSGTPSSLWSVLWRHISGLLAAENLPALKAVLRLLAVHAVKSKMGLRSFALLRAEVNRLITDWVGRVTSVGAGKLIVFELL